MSRRIPLWCAGLSLVVASAAAATHADAQVRSERRVRRTGKQQTARPAPKPDTVTVTRTDTVRVRDTVFVDRPLPAPPPRVDTVRVPVVPPVRTAYFGVEGGVAFPLSRTKDVTTVGPSIYGLIGFNAPRGPLGLRLDGGYQLLRGKNIGNGFSGSLSPVGANRARPDLAIYSAGLNGVIRARFTKDTLPGDFGSFYIFGGGGGAYLRSFLQDNAAPGIEQNLFRPMLNGGAGLEVGGLGTAKVFIEGRFVYIFTPGQKVTYVPVGLGVRF